YCFFFSSRRRHTRFSRDWSSDVCSSDLLREVIKAAKILREEYQIHSNVYSVTSFNELARDGMVCEEYNRLHPLAEDVKEAWVSKIGRASCRERVESSVVAVAGKKKQKKW